ncbi:hypothetical protein V1477_004644 [Vespula maculifrons]|uniref:Uncharacterized protein n=1 Tax=Vespula maculifrons TaxID=7453 RepID=A0ABD2CMD8_VESMC
MLTSAVFIESGKGTSGIPGACLILQNEGLSSLFHLARRSFGRNGRYLVWRARLKDDAISVLAGENSEETRAGYVQRNTSGKRKEQQAMYSPALSGSRNYPWGRKVTWHVLFLRDKQRRIAGICSYRRNRWTPAVLSKKGLTLNPRDIPSNYAIKKMRGSYWDSKSFRDSMKGFDPISSDYPILVFSVNECHPVQKQHGIRSGYVRKKSKEQEQEQKQDLEEQSHKSYVQRHNRREKQIKGRKEGKKKDLIRSTISPLLPTKYICEVFLEPLDSLYVISVKIGEWLFFLERRNGEGIPLAVILFQGFLFEEHPRIKARRPQVNPRLSARGKLRDILSNFHPRVRLYINTSISVTTTPFVMYAEIYNAVAAPAAAAAATSSLEDIRDNGKSDYR